MTIVVEDGRYFVAQWFVLRADKGGDYLATFYREPGSAADGPWRVTYRFRYYADGPGTPHDGRDEKHWYDWSITTKLSEPEAEARVDLVVGVIIAEGFGPACEKTVIRSDRAETVMGKLLGTTYSHVVPTSPGGDA